jgi:hypothetical protein
MVGGVHTMATTAGSAVFNLAGSATALDAESGLTLGTDLPLRGTSPLGSIALDVSGGATVPTQQVVQLDTALLAATKPLLALTGSLLVSNTDLFDLVQKAKLSATLVPADALVKLDASTLIINSGSLVNVGRVSGSSVSLTGNLFSLTNTSTLAINNGNLVTVSNGSLFKLTSGALGVFGAGTNTLNITNTAACGGCSFVALPNFAGSGVLLRNGALAGNVTVNPAFVPFTGLGAANTVNIGGTSGAVIILDGVNSRVNLNP